MKFNAMFQPIEIGPMTVKNRYPANKITETAGSIYA